MSTVNDSLDYNAILFLQEEKLSPENKRKNTRDQDTQSSRGQENKKVRVIIDSSGRTRRPANITLQDDVKEALDILAVKRRVRPWTLLDQALREFLTKEGITLENE